MEVVGYELSTTADGNPYGGPPKSGWSFVVPAFMVFSQVLLCESTGSAEMSVFHTLSAGKTSQDVPGTGAAVAAEGAAPNAITNPTTKASRFTTQVSAKPTAVL